jgi:hypothetical protein
LPTLESGQFFPLWLQDAATGQVHELVYVTGVSGATLTVERAQEGTSAQNWNIGDFAYSNGSSGTFAPITAVHSPTESETLPTANKMVVTPGTLTANIALTLPASPVVGQEYTIFGSSAAYTVTVQTSVTSGSPYIGLPDGSTVYSWMIPASASLAGIVCVWDGTNWRARTFGTTVVSDATSSNEAVALGQLTNGSISPTFGTTIVNPGTSGNEAVTFSQLGNLNGVTININSDTVLPDTAFGQAFQVESGVTVTLPASNGNPGELLYFYGEGTTSYNIANNTGQFIWAPPLKMTSSSDTSSGATTLTVTNGGTAVLMSRGDGEFDVIGGSVMSLSQLTNGSISPTFGTTVVANAAASNEAVNLGQLFIGNRKSVFTSNGTYTVPDAVTTIWVSGAGGGGGGGGGNSLSSTEQGGGGGGGYAGACVLKTPISVTPGESLTITIGAGGAGGAGTTSLANAGDGSAGGATTIVNGSSTLLSLAGGAGANGATSFGTNYVFGGQGFSWGLCIAAMDDTNGWSGAIGIGGNGQLTPFSVGGGEGNIKNNPGSAGTNGGGGGGGGGAGANGGAGGNGIIIIEW